ncbi:hypothetical protein M758_6G093100 [Ceratodon purpureus]|uniref:Uncharacterized protein n=1 Tax=Ceratodon purpureus TaxID=3225 RepID=A0A8T0HCM2_CERPU|nr:hypothetical protein KC19_6G096600 [Ceratodon purpureus]KAG0613306.1 hypothetical protein M758_6G093100 [Ceratodon purpureus]
MSRDTSEVCKWPIARPLRKGGHICIGPARYDSLYLEEFVPPKRSDYAPPKTGGGWHNASSRRKYVPSPFKLDKSLYSVEFSRIKVPGQSDFKGLQKRVDPWLPKFPGEPEKKKDRCGVEVERDGPDGPPDFEDTLAARGRCCHTDHQRFVSKAENPLRYPFSKYDPVFVDFDRPLTPPKIPVKPYPKRVTEDDVRNNPPTGWKGTKGFFTPEPHGHSSETGLAAAGEYYKHVRPYEGTLLAMNANRSIKSRVMS